VIRRSAKDGLHPQNRFREGYDFRRLIAELPQLASFVRPNAFGDLSVDYANPDAVKALNQALLKDAYGLEVWDVPPGYLCPAIPGRTEYVHRLADLIRTGDAASTAARPRITVLDIGMGATCIYPLIGASEFGWHCVGSDIDPTALRWARRLVAANPSIAEAIECRLQTSPSRCFGGIIKAGERFDASMCNPPFHASAEAAAEQAWRKRRNLGTQAPRAGRANFGGIPSELWCEGGELAFVRRMIAESADWSEHCRWFTTLVSRSEHLPRLYQALRAANAVDVQTLVVAHGQKQSRILAWTFARA
jgi:23S rRNA (adenine1618-N6)-methyltransferase